MSFQFINIDKTHSNHATISIFFVGNSPNGLSITWIDSSFTRKTPRSSSINIETNHSNIKDSSFAFRWTHPTHRSYLRNMAKQTRMNATIHAFPLLFEWSHHKHGPPVGINFNIPHSSQLTKVCIWIRLNPLNSSITHQTTRFSFIKMGTTLRNSLTLSFVFVLNSSNSSFTH